MSNESSSWEPYVPSRNDPRDLGKAATWCRIIAHGHLVLRLGRR
jgi:hypothetical protein